MRILLIIIACFLITASQGQSGKIIANGSPGSLYINHNVTAGETYISIASKFNVSPYELADYNNLDYYNGRLLAKFLKVPLNTQNFINTKSAPQAYGLTPVYKKELGGRIFLVGYFTSRKIVFAKKNKENEVDKTKEDKAIANKKKTITDFSASVQAIKHDSLKTASIDSPTVKQITAYPKSWIGKDKESYERERFGPGRFIKEFFAFASAITLITLSLICVIYFYLSIKKERFYTREKLKVHIVKLLSGAILSEAQNTLFAKFDFEIPRILLKYLLQKEVRQLIIDEIIIAKKSLRGQGGENLVLLYQQLGLNKDSTAKLNSNKWHIKARGIQELAMMNQSKFLLPIFRQTNSKNEYVRMEAQSAIVHFAGFKGLKFLQILTFPISDWQQIKLIDQLNQFPNQKLPDAKKLLRSTNNSVVIFTLKIISVFHHLSLHDSVTECLSNQNEKVRLQAIKCLREIYNSATAEILEKSYKTELLKNKIAILHALKDVGGKDQSDFLYTELLNEDNNIKLAAAEALMNCCTDALDLITNVSFQKGHPYTNILHHLKEELSA